MSWREGWSPLSDLHHEFDRLFESWSDQASPVSRRPSAGEESTFFPACDVEEANEGYLVTLEVPGMKKDDIKIEVLDNQLVVSGERRQETKRDEGKGGQWYSELRYGRFQRSFTLPAGIDPDKVEAHYQDGVLKLAVPKAEISKPKLIKIGSGAGSGATSGGFFGKFISQPKQAKTDEPRSNERDEHRRTEAEYKPAS
jgi:HSP20 family protein